jgi:hypothetical protein
MPILSDFTMTMEGKQAVADQSCLKRKVYIPEIASKVENDWQESAMKTCSGPWRAD